MTSEEKNVSLHTTNINIIFMLSVDKLFFNHALDHDDGASIDVSPMIATIDAMARINGQSAFVIDFDRHELVYRTEQMVYIDEATIRDIKRECANPYWSIISEETLQKLLDIRNNYLLTGNTLSIDDYQQHVCIIEYPILLKNRELFIAQKFTPLQLRSDGITRLGVFVIGYSNKSTMECNIIAPSGRRFRFDFAEKRFLEFNLATSLSLAEKAVLQRARMGMTCEEIAASLCLSVNTVKTHRTHIFKKLKVDTITEALAVVGNYQLI